MVVFMSEIGMKSEISTGLVILGIRAMKDELIPPWKFSK